MELTPLQRMLDDARDVRRRHRQIMNEPKTRQADELLQCTGADHVQQRAKVTCESCGALVARHQIDRYRKGYLCGLQTCRDRWDRWKGFRP